MASDKFVHFDVKSDFSFFQGASKIDHLVDKSRELGMPALAITDTNNLFGGFDFSKKSVSKGVQPIIGAEVFLGYKKKNSNGLSVSDKGSVTLLVQNESGYQNLCWIIAKATEPKPDTSLQGALSVRELIEHHDGLVILSGAENGILYKMIRDGMTKEALQMSSLVQSVFKDRFYIQVSRESMKVQESSARMETELLNIAYSDELGFVREDGEKFTGVPLVASSPVRYTSRERHEAWEILQAVEQRRHVQYRNGDLLNDMGRKLHMRSGEEMRQLFSDLPEAFDNSILLAQRCAFHVEPRNPLLPPFDAGQGRNEIEELRFQSEEGLNVRLEKEGVVSSSEVDEYRKRLKYELDIIENMGFPGYFLIVSDFIKWARDNNIPVGPGRGSGAGSLVAWSLTITDLNPFRFGLLFERFLNPDRVSMPDFDIDFCQEKREDVIKYVADKYGLEQIAQIANFGEIKSKTAIKDASRVIIDEDGGGFSFPEINEITQLIPKKEDSADPKGLKEAYETTPELAKRIDGSDKLKLLYKKATALEGLYRSQGMHAAGIVIADRPLHQLAPMGWDDESGLPVAQYNMKAAESVGLVKFDFLGLKTLSVIRNALDLIKEFHGEDIDIESVSMDDPKVFEMLANGQTTGVFQFESAGMQRVLKQVEPTRIEDLIAVNALYRPGPMEMIPHYARCKKGEDTPHYPDPVDKTKPFLEETFGIMVYQEQVMQMAQVVAGYSLGQADILRRAMGKKIKAEMDSQKEMFIKGAVDRGTSPEAAADLFHHIEQFASYGFNKSHAAAYAVIAYRTAWLKRHYPSAFFAALMTYESDNPDKLALVRDDMKNHPDGRINLLTPDIDHSFASFMPEQNNDGSFSVRFGLNAIKNVSGTFEFLTKEREVRKFSSIPDFYKRVGEQFNKSQLQKLVEAGAFDTVEPVRAKAHSALMWLSKNMKTHKNQGDMFSDAEIKVPPRVLDVAEWGDIHDRAFNAVGFWFGKHPLDVYMTRLRKSTAKRKSSFHKHMLNKGIPNIQNAHLCGLVEDVRIRESRNGNMYVFLKLSEQEDSYPLFHFPKRGANIYDVYDKLVGAQKEKKPVVIKCNLALEEDGGLRIFMNSVIDIDEFLKGYRGNILIQLKSEDLILTNEEYSLLNENKSDTEHKNMVMAQAMHRKIKELSGVLSGLRVESETADAISITIDVETPGYKRDKRVLAGRYRLDPASENRLKSMDGISSVTETEAAKTVEPAPNVEKEAEPQMSPS